MLCGTAAPKDVPEVAPLLIDPPRKVLGQHTTLLAASLCVIAAEALNSRVEIPTQVAQPPATKEKYFLAVLSLAFFAGLAIAIGIYIAWSRGILPPAFHGSAAAVALFFCPPYILTIAVGPTANADLMAAVTAFSIVSGNGFLYAGVAAGLYHVVRLVMKRKPA
jgi:hypothetical protein